MRRGLRYYGEVAILWCGAALLLGSLVALIVLVPKADRLLAKSNTSVDMLNRPCSKNGSNCGTLASLNEAAGSVQGVAVSAQRTVLQLGGVASSAQATVSSLGSDVHADSVALQGVTTAAQAAVSQTSNQLTNDLVTLNGVLAKAQPIEDSANRELLALHATTESLNAQLNSQLLHNMLESMSGVAANLNGTTGDIRTWTDREINPPRCKGKRCIVRRVFGVFKVGATVAPGAYWAAKFAQAVAGD